MISFLYCIHIVASRSQPSLSTHTNHTGRDWSWLQGSQGDHWETTASENGTNHIWTRLRNDERDWCSKICGMFSSYTRGSVLVIFPLFCGDELQHSRGVSCWLKCLFDSSSHLFLNSPITSKKFALWHHLLLISYVCYSYSYLLTAHSSLILISNNIQERNIYSISSLKDIKQFWFYGSRI